MNQLDGDRADILVDMGSMIGLTISRRRWATVVNWYAPHVKNEDMPITWGEFKAIMEPHALVTLVTLPTTTNETNETNMLWLIISSDQHYGYRFVAQVRYEQRYKNLTLTGKCRQFIRGPYGLHIVHLPDNTGITLIDSLL